MRGDSPNTKQAKVGEACSSKNSHSQDTKALWKAVWWPITDLNRPLPYGLIVMLCGIYSSELKMCIIQKLHKDITATLVITVKTHTSGRKDRLWYSQTSEYYSALKGDNTIDTTDLICLYMFLMERSMQKATQCFQSYHILEK